MADPGPPWKKSGAHVCKQVPQHDVISFEKFQRFLSQLSELPFHIMLRDLLTQMSVNKKTVTAFGYPRACRFRKYEI
jgi:hypothetical protein